MVAEGQRAGGGCGDPQSLCADGLCAAQHQGELQRLSFLVASMCFKCSYQLVLEWDSFLCSSVVRRCVIE